MGSFSIWHWLVFLVSNLVIFVIPIALILRKAGFSRAWSLAFFVPGLNMLGLWVLALMRWPAR